MTPEDPFWAVIEPEISWLHTQLRRFGVPESDLDDLTQLVLLQLHSHWREYDRSRPLRPWLMAFVARLAANHRRLILRRRERLGTTADLRESMIDTPATSTDSASVHDARALVIEALDALSDERRAVLVSIDIEELSAPDVASALDVPLNTVYSRLRLARADFTAAVRRIYAKRGAR